MIDPTEAERRYDSLESTLQSWRQGDFAFETFGFITRFDPDFPLNPADQGEVYDSDFYEDTVEGLVVLTQTCDLIRSSRERPYLEVSPLVRANDAATMENIRKGRSPRYAYVSGAAPRMLIADLERVMTIEKSLIAKWRRQEGCTTDQDQRDFSEALARKRARFAFPDDFVDLVEGFRDRVTQKHEKDSPEGKQLRSLREIRVSADPSWTAPRATLLFWFMVNDDVSPDDSALHRQCNSWMVLLTKCGRFSSIDYDIVSLDEILAREYTSSSRLDLDYLSKA